MTNKLWMRVATTMAAGCMAMVSGAMGAQAAAVQAPAREFEVATIRLSAPSDPNSHDGMLVMGDDKFETKGQTLKAIMKFAYGLNMSGDQQIVGGANWIGSEKFDIQAKEDAETVAAIKKLGSEERVDTVRAMVRALLERRFHLKMHRETRELPVYALVVAKDGVKMTPAKTPKIGENGRPTSWSGLSMHGKGDLEARNASPAMLSNILGFQPEIGGRTVIDKTGLAGTYDFLLKWTPDLTAANDEERGASLFTALQEELGLKLESAKAPVEVVVIDAVEQPSEN